MLGNVPKKEFIWTTLKIWLLHRHFEIILIIGDEQKFEERLSVATSVKYFLILMAKVISFSKLVQQLTHLQVFFSWDVMCKII